MLCCFWILFRHNCSMLGSNFLKFSVRGHFVPPELPCCSKLFWRLPSDARKPKNIGTKSWGKKWFSGGLRSITSQRHKLSLISHIFSLFHVWSWRRILISPSRISSPSLIQQVSIVTSWSDDWAARLLGGMGEIRKLFYLTIIFWFL